MKYRTILIFGAPGSGKGTQGRALGTLPGFFHFECGEVFRSLDTTTEVGKAFLEYSSRGELVPDEITIRLWKSRINQAVKSRDFKPDTDYLVLDGIPRDVNQARHLDDRIDVHQVFYLTCSDQEQLILRLKHRALKDNRFDDANEKVIRRRLEAFERESKPLLDYYGSDRIRTLDALMSPAKVLLEILRIVTGPER